MDSGAFYALQIGYDVDHNEIFRAIGSGKLSLAWIHGERIIAGSIGLNAIVSLLSVLALFAVVKRRFEVFSSVSLLLFSAACIAISSL